jgi:hypothetical protein
VTEEQGASEWFPAEEEWSDDPIPEPPRWRSWVIRSVALLAALALAAVPLGNYLAGDDPPVADNGLEICRFDYCAVEETMADMGLELEMIRLHGTILGDDDTAALVDRLIDVVGADPVEVRVVDDLEGRLGGVYMPASRLILIERPSNAWVVAHEVAHVIESGHGDEFRNVLADLARQLRQD